MFSAKVPPRDLTARTRQCHYLEPRPVGKRMQPSLIQAHEGDWENKPYQIGREEKKRPFVTTWKAHS